MAKYWKDILNKYNKPLDWKNAEKEFIKLTKKTTFKEGSPNWVFRGLKFYEQDNDQLLTSFDLIAKNTNIDINDRWRYEALILREFIRCAHLYLTQENIPDLNDKLEWLSLMRHYKAPTRLMDFTYSFYIAAYFAYKSAKNDADKVCLWAINHEWLRGIGEELLKKLRQEKKNEKFQKNLPKEKKNEELTDFHQTETFSKLFFPIPPKKSPKCVIPVNSLRLHKRIIQQHGFFLCPGDINCTFEENLRGKIKKTEVL